MSIRTGIIVALLGACLCLGIFIRWQNSTLQGAVAENATLRSGIDTAVAANRQANATISRLERSANATIRVTYDWSVRNDTLTAVGRDAAVAIVEVRNNVPDAPDCLDTALPDALVASLDRLYGQACATGGGQCPLSGGDRPAGASAQSQEDTAPAQGGQRKPDRPATGDVGGRPAGSVGRE